MTEPTPNPLKRILIRVPAWLHKAARRKSVEAEVSMNEVLLEKLEEWVNDKEKEPTKAPKKK